MAYLPRPKSFCYRWHRTYIPPWELMSSFLKASLAGLVKREYVGKSAKLHLHCAMGIWSVTQRNPDRLFISASVGKWSVGLKRASRHVRSARSRQTFRMNQGIKLAMWKRCRDLSHALRLCGFLERSDRSLVRYCWEFIYSELKAPMMIPRLHNRSRRHIFAICMYITILFADS